MPKNEELHRLFLKTYHEFFDVKVEHNITLYLCKLCYGEYSAYNTWTAVKHYINKHEHKNTGISKTAMPRNGVLHQLFLKTYHEFFDVKVEHNITLYVCKLCHDEYSTYNTWTAVKHYINKHEHENTGVSKIADRKRHPLKPWKDPESLFCDTEFLKDFLDKEPAKGNECNG